MLGGKPNKRRYLPIAGTVIFCILEYVITEEAELLFYANFLHI